MYFFLSNSVFFLSYPFGFWFIVYFLEILLPFFVYFISRDQQSTSMGKTKTKKVRLISLFQRLVDYDWLAGLFASGNSVAICGHPSQPPSLVYRRTRSLAQFLMALPVSRNCIRHLYRNRDCCKADCHSSAIFRSLPSRFFLVSYALGSLAPKIFSPH